MEQLNRCPGYWVDAREIRAFVQVAELAGERQIFNVVRAAVFSSDNMLDMEREAVVVFVQPAVFAGVIGTSCN